MKVVTLKALKIFAIVMTILFVASMSFSIAYVAVDKTNNEYLTSGIVTERKADLYLVEIDNGHILGFYSDDEIPIGEYVYLTIDGKNTENCEDDEIVRVKVDKTFKLKDSEKDDG